MKATVVLLLLVCVLVVSCTASVYDILIKLGRTESVLESELDQLAHANPDDLPLALRNMVRAIPAGQHLCCRNIPVVIETKSRTVKRLRAVKNTVASSHHCGILGEHCTDTDEVYKQETYYMTEYYTHVMDGQCPQHHIVCCNLYLMVAQKCVYLDDLHEVTQELIG